MNKIKINSQILAIALKPASMQVATQNADGKTSRINTHRIYLKADKSFTVLDRALEGLTNSKGNQITAFGYNPTRNEYVFDCDETTLFAMSSRTGLTVDNFVIAAKNIPFSADVEVREVGDEIVGRNGEAIVIKQNHASITNVEVGTLQVLSPAQLQIMELNQKAKIHFDLQRAALAVPEKRIDLNSFDDLEEAPETKEEAKFDTSSVVRTAGMTDAAYRKAVQTARHAWEAKQTVISE
jgi:hypothetical protein